MRNLHGGILCLLLSCSELSGCLAESFPDDTCQPWLPERPPVTSQGTDPCLPPPDEYSTDSESPCPKIKILLVRGTNEKDPNTETFPSSQQDQTYGARNANGTFLWPLASMVTESYRHAEISNLDYWASYKNPPAEYSQSSSGGTWLLKKEIMDTTDRCPNTKIVLMGFSQGAHVVLDAMCGGGERDITKHHRSYASVGSRTCALEEKYQSSVIAITNFGDPRTMKGAPYNMGTSTKDGLFPRQPFQTCSPQTSSKIQSYCDTGDRYCENAATDATVHSVEHYQKYFSAATAFIQKKIYGATLPARLHWKRGM